MWHSLARCLSRLRNTENLVLLGDASFEKDSEGIVVMITAASLMRCVPL